MTNIRDPKRNISELMNFMIWKWNCLEPNSDFSVVF